MKVWSVDSKAALGPQLQEPAQFLRAGEVVAFPTETVYGLGGNAFSDEAVTKIFKAKGRPGDNPLIVHIHSMSQLSEIMSCPVLPSVAQQLAEKFWPGPLTIVLPCSSKVSKLVTCGLDTVGIRMPAHPVALALLRQANVPIAAPSANLSGRPSPTTARHVITDLQNHISGVVDGGRSGVGLESTVVRCMDDDSVVILRPGGVTAEDLRGVVQGEVRLDHGLAAAINNKTDPKLADTTFEGSRLTPMCPGMKYAHYAPQAPVILVNGSESFFKLLVDEAKENGKRVGVLTTKEHSHLWSASEDGEGTVVSDVQVCGERADLASVASSLFVCLRAFDENGAVDVIFSEVFPQVGLGVAVMNRLAKAAAQTKIEPEDGSPTEINPDYSSPSVKQRKVA